MLMSMEREPPEFREVDAATAKVACGSALETLNLTPGELLVGEVDEDGDIVWSGCPRWFVRHPGTMPTIEGIVEDIVGPDRASDAGAGA